MKRAAAVAATLVALLAAHAGAADIVQLKDGRIIDTVPMRVDGDDVILEYENGEVRVAAARIEDYVIDGKPPPAVDDSEVARAKRAKGLVPYKGKWITPARRQKFIEKDVAEKRKEIEDIRAHAEWRNRYQFDTKNFDYESTLAPSLNDLHAEMLEAYFATFKKEWGIKVPKDWGSLKVCFYSSQDEFHRTGGVGGGTLAYYRFVAPRELNCYYDRNDPEASLSYMFHEANHYLTDLMHEKFQYPHWVNEAMAEYWGASVWDAKKKVWKIGEIQQGRLVELQNDLAAGKRLGLADLIDSERDYRHYYWGWSFVHFMLETPKYAKGFKKFFVDLARAKDVKRVPYGNEFKTVTGEECLRVFEKRLKVKDLHALQEEWYAYIEGPRDHRNAGSRASRTRLVLPRPAPARDAPAEGGDRRRQSERAGVPALRRLAATRSRDA